MRLTYVIAVARGRQHLTKGRVSYPSRPFSMMSIHRNDYFCTQKPAAAANTLGKINFYTGDESFALNIRS